MGTVGTGLCRRCQFEGGSKPSLSLSFLAFLLRIQYIFYFLYSIYLSESAALINLALPSSTSNSSCLPRCTPLISLPSQSLVHFPLSLPQ